MRTCELRGRKAQEAYRRQRCSNYRKIAVLPLSWPRSPGDWMRVDVRDCTQILFHRLGGAMVDTGPFPNEETVVVSSAQSGARGSL